MNVNDFDNKLPSGDLLKAIFQKQQELLTKYHSIEETNLRMELPQPPFDLDSPACQQRLKDYAWRVTEEIGEAMNCLKNKPWKQTHMTTDKIHFMEELIDGFHFFIEMLMLCGVDAESLTIMYLNKNSVNEFRIRSKY